MLFVYGDWSCLQQEVRARETGTRTSWLFGVDGMKLLLALLFRMIEHYCRDLAARFS